MSSNNRSHVVEESLLELLQPKAEDDYTIKRSDAIAKLRQICLTIHGRKELVNPKTGEHTGLVYIDDVMKLLLGKQNDGESLK